MDYAFDIKYWYYLHNCISQRFSPVFPNIFVVLQFMFKFMIHLHLVFVSDVRKIRCLGTFLLMNVQLPKYHLLKISFLHWICCTPLSKISWSCLCGSISGYSYSLPLIYVYIPLLIPHSLDYYSYASLEIEKTDSSNFIIFWKYFSYFNPSAFHLNFRV